MTPLSAYAAGISRTTVEAGLRAAGKDVRSLVPADLDELEDFHTLGRVATAQLAELAGVDERDRVLDAGSGIGGTARFLAASHGCTVTGVDQSEDYCQTARWLNDAVGLGERITITEGDVTALPFPDGAFDVVVSQHVQMNVADKDALYGEAHRVLTPGGRLALWDVTGTGRGILYPVPWATDPADSHLVSSESLRSTVETAGFRIDQWTDLTQPASELMAAFLAEPPSALGLHVFVPDFTAKAANLARGFAEGYLQVIQALAVRPDGH